MDGRWLRHIPDSELDAIFFDLDGVLIDSVPIKTDAYRSLFQSFGDEAVRLIVEYHLANGGIDRFRKIEHVLTQINRMETDLVKTMAEKFATIVKQKVIEAPSFEPILDIARRGRKSGIPVFIVSGTPENELIEIVEKRGWANLFKRVRGSPDAKEVILKNLMSENKFTASNCLFIGDAVTDFLAAEHCGIWFIGVPVQV